MDIKRKIRELAKKERATIDELEFYTSQEMLKYAQLQASAILYGDEPTILIEVNPPEHYLGKTNGDEVKINATSRLMSHFASAEVKFNAFMGVLYHELAHCRYKQFDMEDDACEALCRGILPCKVSGKLTTKEKEYLSELQKALADGYGEAIAELYHELSNITSDVHDEENMIEDFRKLVKRPIITARQYLMNTMVSFEDLVKNQKDGKISEFELITSLVLRYLRFDTVFYLEKANWVISKYSKDFKRIAPMLENARWTDDPDEKIQNLMHVIISMWEYFKKELNKQQNGQTGNSSGGGQQDPNDPGTQSSAKDRAIQEMIRQIANSGQNAGATEKATGKSTSAEAKKDAAAAKAGSPNHKVDKVSYGGKGEMGDPVSAYDQVLDQVAAEKAINTLENQQAAEIMSNAGTAISGNNIHKGYDVDVKRVLEVTEEDKRRYAETTKKLMPYVNQLKRQMQMLFKAYEEGETEKRLYFGQRLVTEDVYRPDKRMFATRKGLEDVPSMAISILVDHSGSMGGNRIVSSMEAAMLLHNFATSLSIPVSVAGHRTSGDKVQYIVYTDFDEFNPNDRYRLAQMSTGGCNRDGAALEISCSRLAARPERDKVCIIISDGRPNHDGYQGDTAKNDLRNIVRRYGLKGVTVIAAAIGDDKDTIREIYGDSNFLNISDLNVLPQTLVKLIKKRITNQM